MKTAIVGSRNITDYDLNEALEGLTVTEIISGGAMGVDTLAEVYAKDKGLPLQIFPADWKAHGSKAGPLRNKQIVEACEQLVAIWDGSSKGTATTIRMAQKAGKPVRVVAPYPPKGELLEEGQQIRLF
jgi:predicted Rossmann fold nucleotide-binding protein DprA/Smf involved in DNA uptake